MKRRFWTHACWFPVFIILTGLASGHIHAQDRTPAAARRNVEAGVSLGFVDFVEADRHFQIGGTTMLRLWKGLTFVPEISYLYQSHRDRDFLFLPNLSWQFRRGKKVVPYVIGGFGLEYHKESWDHFEWNSSSKFLSAGFGTKVYLNRLVFLAPEFRTGLELHGRFSVLLGYTLK